LNQGEGEENAKNLVKIGITTSLVPFSAAYALMSRVNKVILGTTTIMKNGGQLAPAGCLPLMIAAKSYSVPVITLAGSIKLTPYFPFE
jgi:translation initiation factor eIF-2B subunit beta